jgi:aldehyde:ferredoxin oxidoreductase
MSNFGTSVVIGTEKFGDMPMRNRTLGSWDEAKQVSGQTIYDKYLVKHSFCFACPSAVQRWRSSKANTRYRAAKVEYETIGGFADDAHRMPRVLALANRCGRNRGWIPSPLRRALLSRWRFSER